MSTEDNNQLFSDSADLSFREKLLNSISIAREDLRSTDKQGKAIIVGMVAMGAYEWGPGNETVAPIIAGQALDLADGVGGVALTAAITGGLVAGQQLFSGLIARKAVQQFPRLSDTAFSYANTGEVQELKYRPFSKLPRFKRWLYAFSLGSSFTVSREALMTGNTADSELKKVSRLSAAISGGSIAVTAAGVDVINQRFENNDSVQFVIDHGVKNPLFWLGVMGATIAFDHARKSTKK